MTLIIVFFLAHWYISLFFHSFFLHRYGAHKMYDLTPFWERAFFILTYVTQGCSFLNPRSYAVLHRMHHEYSDTEKDPHSPHHNKNIFQMMWNTREEYLRYYEEKNIPPQFKGGYPVWPVMERVAESMFSRFFFIALYVAVYAFAIFNLGASPWWALLLPVHFIVGPVQGAMVNWFGHKHGYENFDNHDKSKNTLAFDFALMGELFQNNHHKFPKKPNFAVRWFEFDPTYFFMRIFDKIGIIKLHKHPKVRYAKSA